MEIIKNHIVLKRSEAFNKCESKKYFFQNRNFIMKIIFICVEIIQHILFSLIKLILTLKAAKILAVENKFVKTI